MTRMKEFLNSVALILAYVGVMLVLQIIYLTLGVENAIFENLALLISSLVPTALVIHRLWPKFEGKFGDFKDNFKKYASIAIKNWFVGLLLMMMINYVLISITGYISPNEQANQKMMGIAFAYSVIYVCILAPVAEELLFRLNFNNIFKKKETFMVVSAVMFGCFHLVGSVESVKDILFFLPYSALGYYFAKAYVETDNIYTSIFAHMFHNIFATLLSLL